MPPTPELQRVLERPSPPPPQIDIDPHRLAPPMSSTPTATGLRHELYFRDPRPPHLLLFALERELMVLFTVTMDQGTLRGRAQASVNGARYDFELRFLAALPQENCYLLCTDVSWADQPATAHEYFRQTVPRWLEMWTRDLTPCDPPAPQAGSPEQYRRHCEASLPAQQQLESVPAVQRTIVEGMKQGATFSTAHKEGGTTLSWRHGHFVRSDYGDCPAVTEFTEDAAFLRMLRHFCHGEVTRHAGSTELSELDTWKLILRRMSPIIPPHPDDLQSAGSTPGERAVSGRAASPAGSCW